MPNPIANGKNKGLEEDGKRMPKTTAKRGAAPYRVWHLPAKREEGRKGYDQGASEAAAMECLYSIFPFST
jgi:hypothetical protein